MYEMMVVTELSKLKTRLNKRILIFTDILTANVKLAVFFISYEIK